MKCQINLKDNFRERLGHINLCCHNYRRAQHKGMIKAVSPGIERVHFLACTNPGIKVAVNMINMWCQKAQMRPAEN